jgi:hypothetical protein
MEETSHKVNEKVKDDTFLIVNESLKDTRQSFVYIILAYTSDKLLTLTCLHKVYRNVIRILANNCSDMFQQFTVIFRMPQYGWWEYFYIIKNWDL